MPKIKVKPVEQISRKPVSYAFAAFMRHCQLKNLAPYSYLYYNKNIQYFLDTENEIKYPILAAEWHPTKNKELRPENVTIHSNKKVWWKCSKGHEWQSRINDRSRGRGCPYCSHRIAINNE